MDISAMRVLAALGAAIAVMILGFVVIAIGRIEDGLVVIAILFAGVITGGAVFGLWRQRG